MCCGNSYSQWTNQIVSRYVLERAIQQKLLKRGIARRFGKLRIKYNMPNKEKKKKGKEPNTYGLRNTLSFELIQHKCATEKPFNHLDLNFGFIKRKKCNMRY